MAGFTKETHRVLTNSLKRALMSNVWWDEVQDDVRTRLDWIIKNITTLGTFYVRSYMTLFRWEFERRNIEGKRVINPIAGYLSTLLGMKISEEAFQCGIMPTRAILDLYDYISPTDSDVAACLFLCHKIEILEKVGVLVHNESEMKITPSEMAKAIKLAHNKNARPNPKTEENIFWDFEDNTEDLSGDLN